MTDIITNQQLKPDFRGVPFFIRSEEIVEVGRRLILHHYLNSSQRVPEDIGFIPDKFSIRAFVHGINYLADAEALRAALNKPGSGVLSLLTFGTFNVFALPYTVLASQENVGEIEFTLNFVIGQPQSGPARSDVELDDLFGRTDDARGDMQLVLALLWDKPETALALAAARYDVVQSILQVENDYRPLLEDPTSDAWLNLLTGAALGAPTSITTGLLLANSLIQGPDDGLDPSQLGVWQATSQAIVEGAALEAALAGTEYGDDLSIQVEKLLDPFDLEPIMDDADNFWVENTRQRIIRNENRRLLIAVFRLNSLLLAYEQAAAKDYETETEIIETREQLYNAYDRIIRNPVTPLEIDTRVLMSIDEARFVALDILERKAQFTPKVTAINLVARRSSLQLAYGLYAEEFTNVEQLSERAAALDALNPDINTTQFVGDVSVFDVRSTVNV